MLDDTRKIMRWLAEILRDTYTWRRAYPRGQTQASRMNSKVSRPATT